MRPINLKVLMIAEQCNPDWSSVPLVCFNFYREISKLANVTLVTHARNQSAFEKLAEFQDIHYISEGDFAARYHELIAKKTLQGRTNWPLYHALSYPIYAEFNHKVYQQFSNAVKQGTYDIVHAISPMMPRYPVSMVRACQQTPFILGPVNGGVPFPKGFQATAKKEKTFWNWLRPFGRYLLPGYVQTYKRANKILSGSTYTLEMLKQLFQIEDGRIELFYENGISKEFLDPVHRESGKEKVELLFVGRLVPYKGTDMLIEALGRLEPSVRTRIGLTIVGDGSEKTSLESLVSTLGLQETVRFSGWIKQHQTIDYYRQADIFCFPSVREFGGAVVMEAMACGLPCIVVKNGGIAEYVTDETGFRIEPVSRDYVIQELAEKIQLLVENEQLRSRMAAKSVEQAREFEWSMKAQRMLDIYERLLLPEKSPSSTGKLVESVV